MRTRPTSRSALSALLLCAALAAGCQTYDFEPVVPIAISQTTVEVKLAARANTPNLLLLVDTSGSMLNPMDSSQSACRTSNGYLCRGQSCPAECPTRWRALQGAMASFLTTHGTVARIGLATYPGPQLVLGEQCGGSQSLSLDLPLATGDANALRQHAAEVNAALQGIPDSEESGPTGGTPTGSSLRFVGSLPQLQAEDREDFVLLLTDGLPNCNEANTSVGPSDACRCTLGADPLYCSGNFERLGCLDQDGSVSAVHELRARGIRTIVIGFGAETASGDGPTVLNAMAEAGGFARGCQQHSDCGPGGTCQASTGLCDQRYYQASNQGELAAALQQISAHFEGNPCLIEVDPAQLPTSPKLMVVYVNGERFTAGDDTWRLKEGAGVELLGSLCQRAQQSTPDNPVTIEVRAVQAR